MKEEMLQKLIEHVNSQGGFIEFAGMNCHDHEESKHCLGWDGESRRCDCGNRRVYWTTYSGNDSDDVYEYYGEAY